MLTQLKGGNLDCTSRAICACWYQILRFFNFGGHFYYSNFLRSSNESALRFLDFALFHGFFQVLSLFVTFQQFFNNNLHPVFARFHVPGFMKIRENWSIRFWQGFMYPGSWKLEKIEASDFGKVSCPGSCKLEKIEASDFCKVSCTRGHEN